MRRPEQSFQQSVVQLLMMMLGGNAWFTAFPSGGGGAMRGKILKGMGLKPGVPDILIIDGGHAYWLELKAKRGTVSEAQKECHSLLRRSRSPVAVVKTIDDVLIAIKEWGIAVNGTWSIPVSVSDKEIGGAA